MISLVIFQLFLIPLILMLTLLRLDSAFSRKSLKKSEIHSSSYLTKRLSHNLFVDEQNIDLSHQIFFSVTFRSTRLALDKQDVARTLDSVFI